MHFKRVSVQEFCLTLVGEARLWYESLRPIAIDWNGLQTQYSKIGNTREQLFYAWRSFHFDGNSDTLDSYVACIRQVAVVLGYGEPQVLEVLTKYTSNKIILGSFSYRRFKTGSGNSKRNTHERENI